MKRLSTLGVLALTTTTTGLVLVADPNGTYQAFKIDGLPGSFAYKLGHPEALIALAGDIKDSFKIIGLGEVCGSDVFFGIKYISSV